MLLNVGCLMILLGITVGFILFMIFITRFIIYLLSDSSIGWFEYVGIGSIVVIVLGFLMVLIDSIGSK